MFGFGSATSGPRVQPHHQAQLPVVRRLVVADDMFLSSFCRADRLAFARSTTAATCYSRATKPAASQRLYCYSYTRRTEPSITTTTTTQRYGYCRSRGFSSGPGSPPPPPPPSLSSAGVGSASGGRSAVDGAATAGPRADPVSSARTGSTTEIPPRGGPPRRWGGAFAVVGGIVLFAGGYFGAQVFQGGGSSRGKKGRTEPARDVSPAC